MATIYLVEYPDGAVEPKAYGSLEAAWEAKNFKGQPHDPTPLPDGSARVRAGNGYAILAQEVEVGE